jgi:hypothetical protein
MKRARESAADLRIAAEAVITEAAAVDVTITLRGTATNVPRGDLADAAGRLEA